MYEKIKPYIVLSMAVIIFILFVYKCDSPTIHKQIDNTQTTELIAKKDNQIEKLTTKLRTDSARSDSSIKVVTIVEHHYHTKFDTIYKYAPANCDSSLMAVHYACLQLDSSNKAVISNKDIELTDYKEITKEFNQRRVLSNLQHSNDSTNLVNLHLEVKKQKRTKVAVIVGAILTTVSAVLIVK